MSKIVIELDDTSEVRSALVYLTSHAIPDEYEICQEENPALAAAYKHIADVIDAATIPSKKPAVPA